MLPEADGSPSKREHFGFADGFGDPVFRGQYPEDRIDAEVREPGNGRQLDRDRGDAADARLLACVGETTPLEVPFIGASGPARVVLSDATWPIPPAVPAQYGARARAGKTASPRPWARSRRRS